jgi:hypothetical protein
MSAFPSVIRRWKCAFVFLLLHSTLFLLFTLGYVTSHDPNRGFLWLVPYFVDMPSSLASESLVHGIESLTPRVIVFLVLGGIQWTLIGMLLDSCTDG